MDAQKYLTEGQYAAAETTFLDQQIHRLKHPSKSRFFAPDEASLAREIERINSREPSAIKAYTDQNQFFWFCVMHANVPVTDVVKALYSELGKELTDIHECMRATSRAYIGDLQADKSIDPLARAVSLVEDLGPLAEAYDSLRKSSENGILDATRAVAHDPVLSARFEESALLLREAVNAIGPNLELLQNDIQALAYANAQKELHLLGNVHEVFGRYGFSFPAIYEPRKIIRIKGISPENLTVASSLSIPNKEHPTVVSS